MRDTYIVGVGMTPFGRFLDTSLAALAGRAAAETLADANAAPADAQASVFANATQGALEGLAELGWIRAEAVRARAPSTRSVRASCRELPRRAVQRDADARGCLEPLADVPPRDARRRTRRRACRRL